MAEYAKLRPWKLEAHRTAERFLWQGDGSGGINQDQLWNFCVVEVFRLSREKFASPLSGKGAALKGARWNSPGVELIYTATNRSLAMAEVAVHNSGDILSSDFVMVTIFIPENISMQKLVEADLPAHWNVFPHLLNTQKIGDQFILEGSHCILQIPSVVTKGDFNILINPAHPEMKKIKIVSIEKFPFDQRLFR